jgi:hypothetical protein
VFSCASSSSSSWCAPPSRAPSPPSSRSPPCSPAALLMEWTQPNKHIHELTTDEQAAVRTYVQRPVGQDGCVRRKNNYAFD